MLNTLQNRIFDLTKSGPTKGQMTLQLYITITIAQIIYVIEKKNSK